MAQRWLSLPQAAAGMGVSVRTLERRVARGKIESRLCPDGRREVAVEVSDDLPDCVPDSVGPVGPQEQAAWVALKQADHIAESYDRQLSATRDEAEVARRAMRQAWTIATVSMIIAALALTWAVRTNSQPPAEASWSDTLSDTRQNTTTECVSDMSDTPRVAVPVTVSAQPTPAAQSITVRPPGDAFRGTGRPTTGAMSDDAASVAADMVTDGPTDTLWDRSAGSGVLSEAGGDSPMCVRHDDRPAASDNVSVMATADHDASDGVTDNRAATLQPVDVGQHDGQAAVIGGSFSLPSQRLIHALSLDAGQAVSIASVDAHFERVYAERMADSDRQMQAASQSLAEAQKSNNRRATEDAQVRLSQMLLDRRAIRRQLDGQYLEAVLPLLDPNQTAQLKTRR
ncbi:MAG: hypothetical protein JXL80_14695 [Planctomycetes bacterium]|nr:hypothetical protein [Planctomycetota bacterium]